MRQTRIHIFGDSLMMGTVVDQRFRYKATMRARIQRLEQEYDLQIVNHARFGSTVDKGRRVLDAALQNGLECEYAVVEYGGNDCNFNWKEVAQAPAQSHAPLTRLHDFMRIYTSMVYDLQAQGIRPVLLTLPPLDALRYFKFIVRSGCNADHLLQWLGDVYAIYRFHEMYSNAIIDISNRTGALLVDVRRRFLDHRQFGRLIGPDGIHLACGGYQLMQTVFCEWLDRLCDAAGRAASVRQAPAL